jgi:hypothetical protein
MQSLDQTSRGAFLYVPASEARFMINRISGKIPCTSINNELPEEEKESSPDQEEVLIAKSLPLQSQDLAINPKLSIPKILQGKKKFNLWNSLLKSRMTSLVLILGEH